MTKPIKVTAEKGKNLFFGENTFKDRVLILLLKGLGWEGEKVDFIELSKEYVVRYHIFCTNAHSTICNFEGGTVLHEYVKGEIEVKHWGKCYEGGQIEWIKITIEERKKEKVIFN